MKKIDIDNAFVLNEEFLTEKHKFSLIGHNFGIEETTMYSDEESYIFVLGKSHKPIWIFTVKDISEAKIIEIEDIIKELSLNSTVSFVCKASVYKKLSSQTSDFEVQELSGCYICQEPIKPRKCIGHLEKAREEDKTIITQMWYDDCVEADPKNHISYELACKFVDSFLSSGTFYVWRDDNGKIVSMVDYTIVDDYAEVAHAYTIPEERGKGYMANAVYELTKIIKSNGLIPILSTDLTYEASNACYKKIGYELEDELIVFDAIELKKVLEGDENHELHYSK